MNNMTLKVGAIVLAVFVNCFAEPQASKKSGTESVQPTTASCPLCEGHEITVKTSTPRADYNGKTYYFCSASCKAGFLKEPAKYAQLAAPPATSPALIGRSKNPWDEDVTHMAALNESATVSAGEHVVIRVPPGSIDEIKLKEIVARLDKGIIAAKKFVGDENWNYEGDRKIYFYCADANFISHAPGGNCVFIPLWRMKDDESPWLHEAIHLLLASKAGDWLCGDQEHANRRMPLWLIEGLADAVAMEVSEKEGLRYYSPLMETSLATLDKVAAQALREAPSPTILETIGGRGKPRQLFGPQRPLYAVPFYAASASFVRYLATQHGYPLVIEAARRYDQELEFIESNSGSKIMTDKTLWLRSIGFSDR